MISAGAPPPPFAEAERAASPAPLPPGHRRSGGLPIVILALAVLILAGVLLLRGREPRAASPNVAGAVSQATAAPRETAAAAAREEPAPSASPAPAAAEPTQTAETAETIVRLPTPGPREAADATVGAPRVGGAIGSSPRTTAAERPRPTARAPAPPPPPPARAEVARAEPAPREASAESAAERPDAAYATRRSVRFTSSPEQARLTIDGRAVGIADDWDNRGGGRAFEFDRPGAHDVRMELPGYRTLRLRIDVSPDSEKDNISIDEEMERRQSVPYEKLPAVYDRTTGAVEFVVDPPNAAVSEAGRPLGPASSFTGGSPLQLKGPMVHDLLLSFPGRRSKLVRILVAANAGRERATVKERLKAD